MEEAVTIQARQADVPIVQRAAECAQSAYTDISGRNVKVTVEGSLSKDWSVFFASIYLHR